VPLAVPFVAGAPASYLGFSSLLYQGLILAAFVVTAGNSSRAAAAVPWMGLVITLFRPDGAFFAAAFVIAAGARELRASGRGRFLASTLGAVLVGAIYFVWRWAYFGELLPLPLHVKSHGVIRGPLADQIRQYLPWLNGIGLQLMWLKSALGPAPIAAALAALALFPPRSGGEMRPFWHSARIAAGGSALFLGALSFAFQAQNVHFRYQAPVVLLLVFLLGSLAARRIAEHPAPLRRATVIALVFAGLLPAVAAGARAALASTRGGSYIDVLPARLAEVMQPGRTIALTDAGRLAYWTNTPIVDVAGLNYAPTALRPPSVAMLREIDPDVLLIHPGASVVDETFPPPSGDPAFFEIDRMQIERRIASPYRSVFEQGLERYAPTSNTATVAAAVMLRYLVERGDDYEVEVVRYQGGYRHVFAFRRKLPEAGEIREALAQSTSGQAYAPYAALKGFPFSRRFEVRLDDAAR